MEETGFKFYVHDIVCVGGKREVAELSYHKRMYHVQELLRWHAFPPDDPRADFITMLAKSIFPLSELTQLWRNVIPALRHRCDGLIFTPNELPHTGKKNKMLFKWKQPVNHTVDLQLGPLSGERQEYNHFGYPVFELYTWDTVNTYPFCQVSISLEQWASIGLSNPAASFGAIVECKYDFDQGVWIPVNLRPDKVKPNDISTVKLTIETILECLTIEELLNISSHARSGMTRNNMALSDPSEFYKP
jgi:hypothetical protein